MYVLKLKGDVVWQTAGPDKSEDPLEFELEALLSKRPTPLLVYGEVHRRIKKTLNVDQLDAFTFAKSIRLSGLVILSAPISILKFWSLMGMLKSNSFIFRLAVLVCQEP